MERLDNVKVGDAVVVECVGGAGQQLSYPAKVTKITKTQITVDYMNYRFLKNGTRFGEANKTRGWSTFLYVKGEK